MKIGYSQNQMACDYYKSLVKLFGITPKLKKEKVKQL